MALKNWLSVGRRLLGSAPSYLIFQVTSRCNSRCLTCFNWKQLERPGSSDLSLDEIERVSLRYGPLLQLTLGGGEPFLRDDIADICLLFQKNNGVQHVTIPTNATLPEKIERGVGRMLSENSLNYLRIGLSLDGIGGEHDRLRGVEGNFEKLLETYQRLCSMKKRYRNFGIEISSVLSAYNQDTLCVTIDTVRDLFPEADKHAVVLVRGDARDPATKNVSAETYRRTMDHLKQGAEAPGANIIARGFKAVFDLNTEIIYHQMTTGKFPVPCVAGSRLIVITPEGTVYPCEEISESMGSLRESDYDIQRILASDRAQTIKKHIRRSRCSCTFECAVHASLIFNWTQYPKILYRMCTQ